MLTPKALLLPMVLCLLLPTSLPSRTPQSRLSFPEYCIYYGYPTQTHVIQTKDQYNLKFFRLQGKNQKIQSRDKVILLQHGLQDSSDTWIVNQEHLAPGFILAQKGYDVWVANSRGNFYSSPAINNRVRNFWDFTFDQMAKYDLPAAFQYISNLTQKKIHYIGHSQGTMIMFAALSENNLIVKNNLASYSALGPVAYLDNQESKMLARMGNPALMKLLKSLDVKQLFFTNMSTKIVLSTVCKFDPLLCAQGLMEISEKNNTVNNLKRMPVVMAHFPSGSSLRNMDHFNQILKQGKFQKYDFGATLNLKIYGTKEPPVYNLGKIDFPVHLFVGEYDRLADVKDAERLFNELGSNIKTRQLLKFGHATFIWGKDATYVQELIKIIESSQ